MGEGTNAALDIAAVAPHFDACFRDRRHVVLAVSGGCDSMAMMHLASAWRMERGAGAPMFSVVTVDHALRAGSAAEADFVAAAATRLGFAHTTLTWSGVKPHTGIQAGARAARYRLLSDHLASHCWQTLAMAHTQDDQAETLLMRLARGSGLDGLAGMSQFRPAGSVTIVRPLLSFAKARLVATLVAMGEPWIEDPSNDNADFERVRVRQARAALDAAGLGIEALALSARRLGRARAALDVATRDAVHRAGNGFRIDDLGYAEVSWHWLMGLPEEVRLRVLARVIEALGGASRPLSLASLEAMTEGLQWRMPSGRTLGGMVFSGGSVSTVPGTCSPGVPGALSSDRVVITREFGRRQAPLPEVSLAPGEMMIWDNRFTLASDAANEGSYTVRALGNDGLVRLKALGLDPLPHPVRAMRSIPALWQGQHLAAVPLLGHFGDGPEAVKISCRLMNRPFAD
ncbi:MAG: tRNA lysidine(34) synthetase TilS [Hyphomicrobium sp.]